jgi:hypothetical protein
MNFSKPIGSDFVVSMRCTDGTFNIFVMSFPQGKVRWTRDIAQAFRFTEANALMQSNRNNSLGRFTCRVDELNYQNQFVRTVAA